ncbi:unnamed protein product [Rotaria sordida]|uniref:Uncharacterized protein n=1 Tax=Rotaria sordida TaxID=392033 RepID=A0A814TKG5_9BILA|nr:unnamed protein product [Rotaria sordida]CAF1160965.1 unnamed protein product [Rotaria sordida]
MLIDEKNIDEIINTIRKLHQTTIDHRLVDLTEYLTEFFQSIQPQQSNLFRMLTCLVHDYQDCAALKIEFLQAQCFETLCKILNTDEDNIISILEFIIELLNNSESVQEKFLHFNGYQKFFNSLRYIHSPTMNFINQLIILMIKKSTLHNEELLAQTIDSFVSFINPHIAISLIHWIPYLTNVSYQQHIISSIDKIVLRSLQNKMMACSNGIILALLEILNNDDTNSNKLEEKILIDIFSLLENLSQFSINPQEIRYICQLFYQNTSFKKQLLQLLIKASKNDDLDAQPISSYFDLQQANSGIILPVIRRWPPLSTSSTSHHFSFHCWLKLNHEIQSYPYEGRRQIYSFYSNSMGLESFIRDSSLFISITDHREFVYIEINDCTDLIDGYWHSLTIVHKAQRPSLFGSAFQTTQTCHLTIYIDGLLRKEIKDFKYVSIINDPIISASIGSPSQRPKLSMLKIKNESLSTTIVKKIQPFKGLLSSKTKSSITRKENQGFYSPNVMIIDPNTQDTLFGQSICLYGQLACVWILAETLDEVHVKYLHAMGSDFCRQRHSSMHHEDTSKSSIIFDLLSNHSLLAYHPLACNGHICIDISGSSSQINNGRLINGLCLRLHPFSQSLLNLGGCAILYPLIELFQENDYDDFDNIFVSNENKDSQEHSSDTNKELYSNPIASIIYLIRSILSSTSTNILIEQITTHHNIEILGEYLNHLSSYFIDKQLLISIEQLIESSYLIDSSYLLTSQLIQYILFNFNLWNKSKYNVRILHLQYISIIIQYDKKFDQEKFCVQFFLDIIKQHFKDDTDEQQQLRHAIYGIIQYFIENHVNKQDLNVLLSTISILSISNDVITHELLDFILLLLGSSSILTEKIIEFLCEPNMIEGLYSLLVLTDLSSETKEIVLKIMKYFIESKYISQQIRSQLRLETDHIGFGGIISRMARSELNQSIIQEIFDIIITSNSSIAIYHLNIVLTLCSAASLNVRCIVVRKLMTYFISNPSACHSYAKCHGWQETLAHFFVKTRRSSLVNLLPNGTVTHDVSSTYKNDQNLNSSQGSSDHMNITDNNLHLESTMISDIVPSSDDLLQETHDQKLDLSFMDNITTDFDSRLPYTSSENSLASSYLDISVNLLSDKDDLTTDFRRYSNETIMTASQSNSGSKEDLLSLFKTEVSNDNLMEMVRKNSDLSSLLSQTTIHTSINNTQDSTTYIRSSITTDDDDDDDDGDDNILEEMCETLILVVVMILWKGIVDCDDASWIIRGQIFSALRHLHREHDLYLPLDYIERRILELSMEACLNDIKLDGGKKTATFENNCHELIKLVNDYLSQSTDNSARITENLVNGIIPILDTMLLYTKTDTGSESMFVYGSSDEHWSETSFTGLNILLILLAHSNISFCEQASIRIHSLLNCRPLSGREEAAYLLSNVNNILSSISNIDDSKYCTHLLSLMKIIIDESFDLLQMNVCIPDISVYKAKVITIDDLRQYISSTNREDWQIFIEKITEPYADHYRSMTIRPFQMNMKIWWNNCHEMMNIGIHKRNRQIEVEKLKFQNHIAQPWYQRSRLDYQRTIKLNEQHRIYQIYIDYEWKNRKKYLYGERGLYLNDKNIKEHHWMLSNRENIHRMRCELIENDYFNLHEESSRLRDNIRIDTTVQTDQNKSNKIFKNEQKGNLIDEHKLLDIFNENKSFGFEKKANILIGTKCSLITLTSIADGEFIITDKYIYFFDLSRLKPCQNNFKYPLLWLHDIHLRRYNLRPTAIEFFLINQTNFLLNFDKNPPSVDKKIRRQIFQKLILLKLPSIKSIFSSVVTTLTPQEILKESKITQKWINREISNFDYLMMLNTIAGRTYNDLNQYPIFPWVLKDYTSQVLDIHDPHVFRDFSKPIGIQNPKHIDEVKLKYESFDDPSGLIKKFHYGTLYSNAATVMHYLIRTEPFTTLHIQLQSGKFDIADRQFHSFQSAWTNIMDSPNDGKELIPEFFYLPEFLVNSNRFDLGKLQSNDQHLNDVQLPPWAHDSPEEFIHLHRLALESDYVSAHLHEWIDLIFGYKQNGQAAIDALNVFMYYSYDKVGNTNTIDDSITREAIDGMIQNFGRIPYQLLTEPHPQRQTREQATFQIDIQGRPLNIFQNLRHIKVYFIEIISANNQILNSIIFISIPKNQIRSFIQQGTPDTLVTININGIVGNNGWHSYDKSSDNLFTFEQDLTLQSEKNRLTTVVPFSSSINITSRLFALSHDGKFIFSGGHWDWSLCIYSLTKSKTISSIIYHTDIITCLALDSTGYILVTGSRDTTCVIWYLSLNDNRHHININDQDLTSIITPTMILNGHTAEITCVCVSSELDLVVSGSLDGTCNIYTIEHGIYVRTLRPTDANNDPVVNLKLSDERHILVQTTNEDTHLFLYSINGYLIRTRKFEYHIVDMLLSDQYIILAVNDHSTSKEKTDSTSSNIARIIIKDMFEMTTIQATRLRIQINCIYLTKDSSHLLVSAKDGKLFVLTPEKNYISAHLHEWIDLIFGYKQNGQAAIDALNVFMYYSYDKVGNTNTIDDSITREAIDGMIQNFGRIPYQLLTEPHPQRQTREQATFQIDIQGRPLNIFQNLRHIKVYFIEIISANNQILNSIIFISIPKNQIRSFIQQGTPDTLVTININGIVGNNGWHSYDKSSDNLFTFEQDLTLQSEKNRLTTIAPFSSSINITSRLFALSHDGKFIFSGGHWDWSLCIYSLTKSKTISSIIHHTDIITCLALDSTGYILVTGSRDTTCVIWYLSLNDNRHHININDQDLTSIITPTMILNGHTAEITCVCVSSELDLVVSGSLDGTCNIYTIEHGIYVRTLRPTDANNDPVVNLKLSDERHILVQTTNEDTHLFLYSINGYLIRIRKFEYHVVDLFLSKQYIILAVNHHSTSK